MPHRPYDLLEAPPGGQGLPQVEVVTRPAWPEDDSPARRRGPLALLAWFVGVFLLVAVPASLWNLTRPAVYRATATVLTIVPAERSGAGDGKTNLQHVAIQRQLLLGRDVLDATAARVNAHAAAQPPLSADDLLRLLAVEPLPETNLVELRATGGDPQLLATLVNEWHAAYTMLRAGEMARQVGDRLTRLDERNAHLAETIRAKREALAAFRERFDIVTLERDNNGAMRRLDDLQTALAKAEDDAIAARAQAQALQTAIGNGETVASERLAPTLTQLQQDAAVLRLQVKDLRERYTAMFIDSDPAKRELPLKLAQVEAQLAAVTAEARTEAINGARQAVDSATDRVLTLQRELAEQRRVAARFSTGYAEYAALTKALAELEKVQGEAEAERAQIASTSLANYPQVEIIEAAHVPRDPIGPAYARDLALTAAAGGAAGLLVVLVLLATGGRRAEPEGRPVTGVRVYGVPSAGAGPMLAGAGAPALAGLPGNAPTLALGGPTAPPPRQLMTGEVEALWDLADRAGRQVIGLLLGGVAPEELPRLRATDFDLAGGTLSVPGAAARTLTLPPALLPLLASEPRPAWAGADAEARVAELLAHIGLLASDAGLAYAQEVDAAVLRETWLIWLVRQGARLTELHRVAGALSSEQLRRLAPFSPPGPARPLAELQIAYPLEK